MKLQWLHVPCVVSTFHARAFPLLGYIRQSSCSVADVSAVFIQKAPAALRPYATLEYVSDEAADALQESATQTDLTALVKSVRRGADSLSSCEPLVTQAGPRRYLRLKLHSTLTPQEPAEISQSTDLPLLVPYSSTNEEKVEEFLKNVAQNGNSDSAALLHNIYRSSSLPGHKFRGYTIINKGQSTEQEDSSATVNTNYVIEEQKRDVWFVFPGLGSQFPGMGHQLMDIAPFRESMVEAASILDTEGVDLFQILDPLNTEINTSISSAMVAITSIQVGQQTLFA